MLASTFWALRSVLCGDLTNSAGSTTFWKRHDSYASYVVDTTEAAFRADTQKQDAVIRRIEIIGEAAAHSEREEPAKPSPNCRSAKCVGCATS